MIDPQSWMRQAAALLQEQFGSRLLFVGLQGSYRRGEAREDSDIDIVTILDGMSLRDLAAYRAVLRALPEGEKACGFTCGAPELLAWPPFELFQFAQDTDAWHGELAPLLPPVTRADTVTGARAAVSGLHHYTAYLYVSGDEAERAEALNGVYKGFFFAMQVVHYLRAGTYPRTKQELFAMLGGGEAELLRRGMNTAYYDGLAAHNPDSLFQDMLAWTGNVMRELTQIGAGRELDEAEQI